jgi:hypothetical protein
MCLALDIRQDGSEWVVEPNAVIQHGRGQDRLVEFDSRSEPGSERLVVNMDEQAGLLIDGAAALLALALAWEG